MNADILDILSATDTPGMKALVATFHDQPHRKCRYCGRTSINATSEQCKGCGAPLQEQQ